MPVRRRIKRKMKQKQSQKQVVNVYVDRPRRRRKGKREIPPPLLPSRHRDMIAQLPLARQSVLPPQPAITLATSIQPKPLVPVDSSNLAFSANLQSELRSAIKQVVDKNLLTEQQLNQIRHAIATGNVSSRENAVALAQEIGQNRRQIDLVGRILDQTNNASVAQRQQILNTIERSMRENQLMDERQRGEIQDSKEISAMSFQQLENQNLDIIRSQSVTNGMLEEVVRDVARQKNQIIALIDNTKNDILNRLTADMHQLQTQIERQLQTTLPEQAGLIEQQLNQFNDQTQERTAHLANALTQQIRSLEIQLQTSMPDGTDLQSSIEEVNTQLDIAKREIMNDVNVRLRAFQINMADMINRMLQPPARIISPSRPVKPRSRLGPLSPDESSPPLPQTGLPDVTNITDEPARTYYQGLHIAVQRLSDNIENPIYDPGNNTFKNVGTSKNHREMKDSNGDLMGYYINNATDKKTFSRVLNKFIEDLG